MPTGRMKAPKCNRRDPVIAAAPQVVDKPVPWADAGVGADCREIKSRGPDGRRSARNPVTNRSYRAQGRRLARGLPQAPRPGCGPAAPPGPLPRPRLVQFGIVVV